MNKKKISLFDTILNIIIILLTILAIYWFIQLLLGNSPGLSEFNFAFIILIASFLVKIYREIGEVKVGIMHMSTGIKESFDKIKEDMGEIKNKLSKRG